MKAAALLLFLLGLSPVLFAQSFTVANLRTGQTIYTGIDNIISCTVEGVRCKDILLTTGNGIIEKTSCNTYNFRPVRASDDSVVINKKVNNELVKIGVFHLKIRPVPDPVAAVGGKYGGPINAKTLAAQGGIGAYSYPPISLDINYTVQGFAVSVIRKEQHLFYTYKKGNLFTGDLTEKFKNLQKGDFVVFSLMTVLMPDSSVVNIKPIEFIIE